MDLLLLAHIQTAGRSLSISNLSPWEAQDNKNELRGILTLHSTAFSVWQNAERTATTSNPFALCAVLNELYSE
jgi:hypothetical protein